jgi:formylglycine-generating enzyme required for sulfatase activity
MTNRTSWCAAAAAFLSLALGSAAQAQSCSGDINGDGVTDGIDLAALLAGWGVCPPRITSVTPLQGSFSGGTVITITGSGLTNVTGVTVGGNPCTAVAVLSPTSVRATTPSGAVGQAAIVVSSPTGSALSPTPFTYTQQSVVSVSPSSGPYQGGTPVTITGLNLLGTTAVTFGGVPATNVQVVSNTQVTAVTPPGSVGVAEVTVSGPWGTITALGGFTYGGVTVPSWATLIEAQPDPAVVTSATLRAAIIATGYAWRVRDTGTQIEMVLIPPGTFQMGCSASSQANCLSIEFPVHAVTLTQPFYLGRYEVTQAQWTARMGSNPSGFQSASAQVPASQVLNRPVENVTWNMIQPFLNATGMRLPTEAEWEYAYRAGTTTAYHSMPGSPNGTSDVSMLQNIAWFNANALTQTRPVGQKPGNGFGLHDMSGNVWEWTRDWYAADYYTSSPSVNPPGPSSGVWRVLRGGSIHHGTFSSRSSERNCNYPPDWRFDDFGFRVVRNP